jgi:3-deoxy-alpha-D-manno-octulosonate 8-oxidase
MRRCKNVLYYTFGNGALSHLEGTVKDRKVTKDNYAIYCIDHCFSNGLLTKKLPLSDTDKVIYINTDNEPDTDYIDEIVLSIKKANKYLPAIFIAIGGGSTLDITMAASILMTNGGRAEDYQGWDLVKDPGVFTVGVPTISGTGAESSRTCVMTNHQTGKKLGMNSDYSVFNCLILDPDLSKTVPKNQYFYTGMDTYIHCIESLNGRYRNFVGDGFSQQALKLSEEIFLSSDMQLDENRKKLMVASYFGGCAIASSYVGLVHPLSAALGVVLGIHHGLANCIVMTAMEEFYPKEVKTFWEMVNTQQVEMPRGLCHNLSDSQYDQLYNSMIIHEKPLANALGDNFKEILTKEKVLDIFNAM